ncbi:MAG: tetratricopeptide repeat protein [Clostridia bacterium]|jgi:tetratricopeptide (TPR) repeat protein
MNAVFAYMAMYREQGARMNITRTLVLLVLCIAVPSMAWSTDFAERGIRLFMENRPQEAVPVLEMAVKEAGVDEKIHLYLGVAYQQLERWDDAIAAFRRGLVASVQYRHLFLFNIANSFFSQGRNAFALESFDQAIAARTDYAPAYLNRANARMKAGNHTGAVEDYSLYLSLDPSSSQAADIRRLIDLIGQKAREDEIRQAEVAARKLAEEQARQALLDAVARSLRETAESTTNLSAGSGGVQSYDDDFALDD